MSRQTKITEYADGGIQIHGDDVPTRFSGGNGSGFVRGGFSQSVANDPGYTGMFGVNEHGTVYYEQQLLSFNEWRQQEGPWGGDKADATGYALYCKNAPRLTSIPPKGALNMSPFEEGGYGEDNARSRRHTEGSFERDDMLYNSFGECMGAIGKVVV